MCLSLQVKFVGSLTALPINCTSLAPVGSASALTIDELEFQESMYKLELRTSKAWKNSFRQLVLILNDGSQHLANFKFT